MAERYLRCKKIERGIYTLVQATGSSLNVIKAKEAESEISVRVLLPLHYLQRK